MRERLRLLLSGVRTRILASYVVLLTFATLGSLAVEQKALHAQLGRRISADLNQEAQEIKRLVGGQGQDGTCVRRRDPTSGACEIGRDPLTGQAFGNNVGRIFDVFLARNIPSDHEVFLTFVDGHFHAGSTNPDPSQLLDDDAWVANVANTQVDLKDHVHTRNGRVDYLAVPLIPETSTPGEEPLGVFVVAQFRDLMGKDINEFVTIAGQIGLGTLLVGSLLAFGVANRILRPMRLMAATAREISETDLSRRIQVEKSGDEIAAMGATFNAMLTRLEDAFDTQRRFIDDAGHELRTPITIIQGHLELLGQDDDPAERRETIRLVTDELDRMTRMVSDLLMLAKLERPDFLALETVDVAKLTEEFGTKAAALADRDWRVAQVGAGRIVADRQRLTQAVMQLAQNATQHTEPGDLIELGSAVANDHALFWVRDTGSGILPEDQNRVFERFARATSQRRRAEGAGLGLSIVQAIAEAHCGHVTLSSRPGEGATFEIIIPVDRPAVG